MSRGLVVNSCQETVRDCQGDGSFDNPYPVRIDDDVTRGRFSCQHLKNMIEGVSEGQFSRHIADTRKGAIPI